VVARKTDEKREEETREEGRGDEMGR